MDSCIDTSTQLRAWGFFPRFPRFILVAWALGGFVVSVPGNDAFYQDEIVPLLEETCYDCHDYESKKGGFSLDDYFTFSEVSQDKQQWFQVYKNLQAHVMPPPEKSPPTLANRQKILDWIKRDVFEIDPNNPDPGRVTHRRLNRVEYENTLFDLTGIRILSGDLLPNDDTGYGFDNIADALSLSPLILEKYIKIAGDLISQSIPDEPYELPHQEIEGEAFRDGSGKRLNRSLSFAESHSYQTSFQVDTHGPYRVMAYLRTPSFFNFDYGKAVFDLQIDGESLGPVDLIHSPESNRRLSFEIPLKVGRHELNLVLQPNYDFATIDSEMQATVETVTIEGPIGEQHKVLKPQYARYFPKGPAPESPNQRSAYIREILEQFAYRAYRQPPSASIVDRLATFAETAIESENQSFEQGMAKAFTAILSSPYFLYRSINALPSSDGASYPLIDEFSLASRLSYFLWSTMPDEPLLDLAKRGALRDNLDNQIDRMLSDEKAEALAENFVGQWLQSRDIPLIGLNEREILRGDGILDRRFRLSGGVRRAMKEETEMSFQHLLDNNLSLLELLDADYTFLNDELAEFYKIEGVVHGEMRKVDLPENSYRGGILTQATVLGVTSNPTRTSPVKRGLFILENILGTPAPPAPPDVPELEEAEKEFDENLQPSMRELMSVHREKPLCRSCHERMDPLGLALENFNAMGMWRDHQAGTPIDPSGTLITGESFSDIRDLKRILANERRFDYYRVVSEKMLTYALGRGLEYYDTHTVDSLVAELERNDGRIMTLITGIIDSPAFQRTRSESIDTDNSTLAAN